MNTAHIKIHQEVNKILDGWQNGTICRGDVETLVCNLIQQAHEIEAILIELTALATRPHYVCEDCWYSCPKSEEGCCDENKEANWCDCGTDEHNTKVETVIQKVRYWKLK